MIISPISLKALDEAKLIAVKALAFPTSYYSSAVLLRRVREARDMTQIWNIMLPENHYRFIEGLKAVEPKTPHDAKVYIEIAQWVRRYAVGLEATAWPSWDDSEE